MSAIDAKNIIVNLTVVDNYSGRMNTAGNATASFGNKAHAGMTKAATGMQKFGAVATKIGMISAIGMAVGLALSAKAAIDFESSFAGVRKTVEASEAGFRALADGVREMALEIPIGVNELNRIMELGGQLGVEQGGLLEFTETIAKIGVTTTLSTEQASMGFARLDNIMQLGGGSFERMGSAIVDLGNNFAATEDEILTFALRIAPMGMTVGMTVDQVLALATAFTSVGIPAERGGTAVQKTLIKMSDAAADGGPKLEAFAKVAGMTADEFARLFKRDPSQAFSAFITGMGDMTAAGENTVPVFKAMELSNQRVIQSILAMANADEVLIDALDLSADALKANNALTEEAGKRFGTTASKILLAKNNINDLAISIGSGLLPVVGDLARGFIEIIQWIDNLGPAAKQSLAVATGALVAFGLIASGHPVIAGLMAVAGAIAWIGYRAEVAEHRVKTLKEVLEQGMATDLNLDTIFSEELISEWLKMGFNREDISKALTGTEREFKEWADQVTAYWNAVNAGADAGLSIASAEPADIGLMGGYRREIQGIAAEESALQAIRNRAKILGITNLPGMEAERKAAEAGRAAVQQLYRARQGLLEQGVDAISPVSLQQDQLDDVSSAFEDHADRLSDSFDDIADSVTDYLDMWYEFPEEFDAAFDEAIASFGRQIEAVGDFEENIRSLNLSPAVESLLRQLVPTPAHMEAWTSMTRERQNEIIAELSKQGDVIQEIIAEKWAFKIEAFQFTSGQLLLDDIAAVANEILNDPENIYNPAEVWLGLIQATMAEADTRGIGGDVSNWLLEAFSDDGSLRSNVDMTKAMIDELITKLLELQGDYDVTVTTTFSGDPIYGAPLKSWEATYPTPGRNAFGGNVVDGVPTLTGEYGTELFVPYSSGTILSAAKLEALFGNSGSRSTVVNVYRAESNDLPGDISEGLTRASITEQVDMIGAY